MRGYDFISMKNRIVYALFLVFSPGPLGFRWRVSPARGMNNRVSDHAYKSSPSCWLGFVHGESKLNGGNKHTINKFILLAFLLFSDFFTARSAYFSGQYENCRKYLHKWVCVGLLLFPIAIIFICGLWRLKYGMYYTCTGPEREMRFFLRSSGKLASHQVNVK